jgi:hypothetical protein
VATGDPGVGSHRFVTLHSGFGVVAGAQSGAFSTDPRGRTLLSAGQAGAVRQYVKPGLNLTLAEALSCNAREPWSHGYDCGLANSGPQNVEGALQAPN